VLPGSVAIADQVEGIVRHTVAALGKLDVLYNNAAIYWPHQGDVPVDRLEEDVWDAVIATNLTGVYLCSKYAIPALVDAGGGSIINVSSLGGMRGARTAHAYAAAKGGVISLTFSMARAYGKDNIRVNAIAPGAIDTPMFRATNGGLADMADFLERVPLGRVGRADDIVGVALFLASDASAYVTGTIQTVDGGFSLT
jgi:NAD(P)-dependent dehydrogenase (short-subunit alcohol dehydrogenase family)